MVQRVFLEFNVQALDAGLRAWIQGAIVPGSGPCGPVQ